MSRIPPLYDVDVRELKEAEEALHVALMYATQFRLEGTKLALVEALRQIVDWRVKLEAGESES